MVELVISIGLNTGAANRNVMTGGGVTPLTSNPGATAIFPHSHTVNANPECLLCLPAADRRSPLFFPLNHGSVNIIEQFG